jgi:hypothetical protein
MIADLLNYIFQYTIVDTGLLVPLKIPAIEKKSGDRLLSLFYGAPLGKENLDTLAAHAAEESMLYTLKMIAHYRCVDKDLGCKLLHWLQRFDEQQLIQNIPIFVSKYGRFDDLVDLPKTSKAMHAYLHFLGKQLIQDRDNMLAGKPVSMAAKWIPSETSAVNKRTALTFRLAKVMKVSLSTIRKLYISPLRTYIESQQGGSLCKVPRDIPHLVVCKYLFENINEVNTNLEALWNPANLCKTAILCDNSASMAGLPMLISVTLALMSKHVLTFESKPRFVDLDGDSLFSNIGKIRAAPFENKVDIRAALDLLKDKDVNRLIIVSDMKLREADPSWPKERSDDKDKERSDDKDKERSDDKDKDKERSDDKDKDKERSDIQVYFWKVGFKAPPSFDKTRYTGITTVSGYSEGLLRCICNEKEDLNPHNVMMNTLSDKMFDDIQEKIT